jgi:hypothetical protein
MAVFIHHPESSEPEILNYLQSLVKIEAWQHNDSVASINAQVSNYNQTEIMAHR